MKYSLRSLMIMVTTICVVLGSVMARVEYLRQWAVYHEPEANLYSEGQDDDTRRGLAYSLRSLMVVGAVAPPLLALCCYVARWVEDNNVTALVASMACFVTVFGVLPFFILRRSP